MCVVYTSVIQAVHMLYTVGGDGYSQAGVNGGVSTFLWSVYWTTSARVRYRYVMWIPWIFNIVCLIGLSLSLLCLSVCLSASTRRPWVMTLRIAQPGELCAMKQSASTKIRESMLWNTKEQSGRGFNLAATSALGPVTVALASAAPELDFTLINKLTDDKRSIVFDSAVRSVCL